MKKIYILTSVFLLFVFVAFCFISNDMSELNLSYTNTIGNTHGNVVNNSFVTMQNEWIYCQDGMPFMINRSYAFNSNSKKKVYLGYTSGRNLNVVGEWMFFERSEGWGGFSPSKLYRKNLKTNKNELIDGVVTHKLIAYNGWLYYINAVSEPSGCLYKAKYDGSEITQLTDFAVYTFAIIDNLIYTESNKIIILSLDGEIKNTISYENKLIPISKHHVIFTEDDMYFVSGLNSEYGIAKLNMNTQEYTQITDEKCSIFNIQGEWIYFSKEKDLKLYKIKIDGTQEQQVGDVVVGRTGINIIEDWIYYYNNLGKLYRIKYDGSINEKL